MSPTRAVFTALLGGYEKLIEQPTARESDAQFICFTDDPNLKSTSWTIHVVDTLLPLDMFRSQRAFKIRGHQLLEEFDETLYIDNSVFLKQDPSVIIERWLAGGDIAISRHSFRERVIDEFDEILELNYDDPHRVNEQLLYYAQLYPDVLMERPYWNGMIARRNTADVRKTMNLWFDHVLRFSRRDQLSANVAFSLSSVPIAAISENNLDSESHQWPAGVQRKAQLTKIGRRRSGPAIAEIARLHREIRDLTPLAESHLVAAAERAEFEAKSRELEQQLVACDAAVHQAKSEIAATLVQLHELRGSLSWRATAPLRRVRSMVGSMNRRNSQD